MKLRAKIWVLQKKHDFPENGSKRGDIYIPKNRNCSFNMGPYLTEDEGWQAINGMYGSYDVVPAIVSIKPPRPQRRRT